MPKPDTKVVYPVGVREISEDLSTDDLVRRLKDCAQAFQNLNQDDNNTDYVGLAVHLASDHFLEHSSKDVRLLIACCIADVFRVFAPEAPYKDPEQLKTIFEFFISQLRGLEDPKDPAFKRYFYLLENLAWVKSFNICIELENSNSIFCQLYTLMFTIINDNHSHKVRNFMLDMMCPLISEADVVTQELLDIILAHIIEPRKSQNKNAYTLAKDILKRTSDTVEPYIQSFFNNAIILGKTSDSDLTPRLYDLIYELNSIVPSILLSVLPQLDFKLKSNEPKERLDATRLLARMFSDKESAMSAQNINLWNCFLGRFNDISVSVRTRCVQYSMHFLLNHPELKADVTEQLKKRQHDADENVRYEVVMAIISAAKKDFSSINDDLLRFVKERTLDKKFKIRKEALLGLATLYKHQFSSPNLTAGTIECLSWIRNKVLHVYYQTALEDRLLVERILHTCLVPYNLPSDQRMKKLFQLYSSIDNNAVKAFNELLKCQNVVRNQVRAVIDVLKEDETPDKKQSLHTKIAALSKSLPESVKCQEFLKKFCALMTKNETVRNYMETIVRGDVTCKEAESSVKEVLKACGMPVMTNSFYTTIKQLLERVAPMVVDRDGVLQVIGYIEGCISSGGVEDPEPVVELLTQKVSASQQAERGLRLLLTLTSVFPMVFQSEDVILPLIKFLDAEEGVVSELSLQIITNVGENLENIYPNIAARLMPILLNFIQHGNVKQAKSAVKCLDAVVDDKQSAFKLALEHLKNYLSLDSKYFRTALVSIGQIAYLCSDHFGNQIKSIVYKTVVKDLLMTDKEEPREEQELWMGFDMLPEETRVKMEGMKMLVKWLLGLKNHVNSARSALRLLSTCIRNKGDLMEKGHVCPGEKSWLRLTAATCMLKLVQESSYADVVTHEQFQGLAALMKDECKEVRERFATKLHKRLLALKLPLEYLGILSLAGHESSRETKIQIRHYLWSNINKRRDYLKQHPVTNTTLFSLLPDYVLPYTIHLLAHDNDFKRFDNVQSLLKIRDNLWFIMEPLMMRNENYSFSFFKRLIDNIKQTEDAQNPKDDASNKKLYAVCDLALSLVMSKTTNFILKEYPVEPLLPNKLYVNADPTHGNTRSYLPSDFQFTVPKRSRMETELAASKSKTRPIIQPKSNGTEGDEVTHDDIEHEPASKRTKGNEESKENASPDDGCVMDNSQDSSLMQSKRGRGRLPKPNVKTDPIEVSTQTVDQSDEIHDDDDDDIDSFSSEQTSTAKRGRGRPPKIPAAATTGRRSPKLSSSDSESATKRSRKKPKYLEDDFEEDPGSADDDSDGESKTSNSELKRRPGRPVKNKSDSTSSSLLTTVSQTSSSVPAKNENNSTSSSAQTNSSQTSGAVRTRGRPPKPKDSEEEEEDDFKEEEVTAKRGRGRRPQVNKTSTEESEVDNEESSGVQEPKRGRGRPSKTNTPSVEETDDTEEENIHEVRRAVGRLSKSTEEADKEENVQEVKRGRGRPSKTNTPSVEETDDTEEENIHEIRRAVGRLSKSTKEADEEEDVQEVKRGRGRPAKQRKDEKEISPAGESDDEGDTQDDDSPAKRKRGRPSKNVSSSVKTPANSKQTKTSGPSSKLANGNSNKGTRSALAKAISSSSLTATDRSNTRRAALRRKR